jgi:hypothetical protein
LPRIAKKRRKSVFWFLDVFSGPLRCKFLGSATVPVAVGRVSRPTFLRIHREHLPARWPISTANRKTVFGETPNTARETHALPKTATSSAFQFLFL